MNQEEQTNLIINKIYELTGESVNKDDPLVIAALINKISIDEIEKKNENLIKNFAEVISKKAEVKKRNLINITMLLITILNSLFIIYLIIKTLEQ